MHNVETTDGRRGNEHREAGKVRITIIGPAHPLRGGIAHHVYWLQRELTARGHAVQVISFRSLYPPILFPGISEADSSSLKLDPNAEAILTGMNPATWREAAQAVRAFAPDLALFQWWQPYFGLMVGTLARLFQKQGCNVLLECHNVYPHERSPIDWPLLKYAFSAFDSFLIHSEKHRKALLGLAPRARRVLVSPLPTVSEFCDPGASARSGRTILFFGKVRKYKGLNVLLEAMPRVLSKVQCQLLIVGEFYDPLEKYRLQIRDLGLEGNVKIDARYMPNEEVPGVFQQADVLVMPYISATQSGVARIALSNGLPIIATRTGGLEDSIDDNVTGMLCPPGNAEALADRIITYFTNNLGPEFSKNILSPSHSATECTIIDIVEQAAGSDWASQATIATDRQASPSSAAERD